MATTAQRRLTPLSSAGVDQHTEQLPGSTTRRLLLAVVVVAPAAIVLVGGWAHRWVDEDAYINLRVVDHVVAGHGPVFNEGERVEAFTSPLWILAMVAARLTVGLVVRMEWVAVLVGVACATAAFVIGGLTARRLDPGRVVVPLGLLMVASLPVVWDYATSGLEMSMVWLWLAGCWWVLVDRAVGTHPLPTGPRTAALVLLGIGPLIRPDLVLMAGPLLVAWVAITRPGRRRLLADAAVVLAAPVVYEVFRMGYYASPVPNTGLAKGASSHFVFAGVDYLEDLVTTYALWVPLVPLLLALAATLRRGPRPLRVALLAMVGAALLHGTYIVYIGGDYMHGRLLLPALFALGLPAGVALERRLLPVLAVAVGAGWAAVVLSSVRYENPKTLFGLPPVTDRRAAISPDERVVRKRTIGDGIREAYDRGERGVLFPDPQNPIPRDRPMVPIRAVPGGNGDQLITLQYSIGVLGYQAGPDVTVVDLRGLADPLSARAHVFQPWRYIAGHRKLLEPDWYAARYGFAPEDWEDLPRGSTEVDPPAVAAARRALACPPLSDLIDAVEAPLTPGRFLSNLWRAPSFATLGVPEDPLDAEGTDCVT